MEQLKIPMGYHADLNLHDTQVAIKTVKDFFQQTLSQKLNLLRVSAPIFVSPSSGLNDNLNGVERPVSFDIKGQDENAEIVHSLAKWKRYALKKYGINAKESDFAEFVGCGENRYVGGVAEKYGVPYRTEMKDYLYTCYGEHVKEEANIPDGVLDVLHTLRARGYRLAVCSSADRVKVLMNLSAIGADEALFDHLVTGTDIKNPKPDPEIYLTGASSLGLAPSECIVVEDAPSGIRAAHAAGIEAIGLATSFPADYLRQQAQPDYLLPDLKSILTLL